MVGSVPDSSSRTRLSLATVLVVIAALPLAAGCFASATPETVLRFWAMGREGEVVAELLPEFERSHPGIRVTVQQVPWTAAHEKLLTAFAGDATPDLCQLGNTWIPELVALNALAPWPLIVLNDRELYTLPVALASLSREHVQTPS